MPGLPISTKGRVYVPQRDSIEVPLTTYAGGGIIHKEEERPLIRVLGVTQDNGKNIQKEVYAKFVDSHEDTNYASV